VYLTVLLLIDRLSFPPVAGAEDADTPLAPSETHRHHPIADLAETEIPLLHSAVIQVFGNHALRIEECALRQRERYTVLGAVRAVLDRVPLETWPVSHMSNMPYFCMERKCLGKNQNGRDEPGHSDNLSLGTRLRSLR